MAIKPSGCRAWWLLTLISACASAVSGADLRLVTAAQNRDKPAVRSLLNERVDVNVPQADGTTALAWAAHWDDLETADLLMRAGADVNAANEYGVTPLSLACVNRNIAMVEKFLRAKANPNSPQLTGETALMTCARTGSVDAVRLLLEFGADVNAKESHRGQTALMWAAAEKHPEVVQALVQQRADVHARSTTGFTPLLFAAQQGDIESARILLSAGANVNETAPGGMTPLLIAASSGRGPLATFLLDQGADANAADSRGYTALHYSASNRGLLETLKTLLARGANPNAQLAKGEVGATAFFLAATAGNVSAMRALAEGGADPLIRTKEDSTALMAAAGVGRYESRSDAQNRNALEAVKLAAELGTDVNAVGENGWTALHGAAYTGSDAIVQFLVEKGAKPDVLDKFGQTPLSIAEAVVTKGLGELADVRPRRFRESTVALLLKLGATPTAQAGVEAVSATAVKVAQ
jgi:ankyrin repeat protein